MTDLKQFSQVEKGAAELRATFQSLPAEIKDKGDLELVKAFHKDVKSIRIDIDKRRKELKQPYLDAGREIDALAKKATALVADMEKATKAQLDAHKAAQEAAKVDASEEVLKHWGLLVAGCHICESIEELEASISQIETELKETKWRSYEDAARVARGAIDALARRIMEVANAPKKPATVESWAHKWGVSDKALEELQDIIAQQ